MKTKNHELVLQKTVPLMLTFKCFPNFISQRQVGMMPLFELFSWNCFINLFSWTSDTTAMFAFYLCVHHKCANCPNLISLAFYFHELVQHKLSFMIFFLHQTPPLCLPLICVLKWTNCPKLISQRCQACCLLFSWTCSN